MCEHESPSDAELTSARLEFRQALLLKSYETRTDIGEAEAAAGRFSEVLRRAGLTPEAMLIDA